MVNCYFYGRDWTVPACCWRGRCWRWWCWWWRSSLHFLLLIQISSVSARFLPVLGCQSETDANEVLGFRRMGEDQCHGCEPLPRETAWKFHYLVRDILTSQQSEHPLTSFESATDTFMRHFFFISHQMLFNASVRHFCRGAARLCFRKLKSIEHLEDLLFLTLNQDYLVLLPLLLLPLLVLHPVHQDVF